MRASDRPSAPQATNVYPPTFLLVWEPKRNKLIAHQCDQMTAVKTEYQLTSITWPYRGLKCWPIEVEYFLKVSADKLTVLNDRRLRFIFYSDSYEMCLCHYGPVLLGFWLQTDLGRKIHPFFWKYRRGRPFLTMVTRWSRSTTCSDWSKVDRWVHAENLCSILKVFYFDSWGWQSWNVIINIG